jgi:hypothetical protein
MFMPCLQASRLATASSGFPWVKSSEYICTMTEISGCIHHHQYLPSTIIATDPQNVFKMLFWQQASAQFLHPMPVQSPCRFLQDLKFVFAHVSG